MFWCCCGTPATTNEYAKIFFGGFSEYFRLNSTGAIVSGTLRTSALVRSEVGSVGHNESTIIIASNPTLSRTSLGYGVPTSYLLGNSKYFNIDWLALLVRVQATVGQPITSAVLRLRYANVSDPPIQPIPVKAIVSRRCFTLPNLPGEDLTEFDISPYPFDTSSPNKRPWNDDVYGTTPNPYTHPTFGTWGSSFTPWITPAVSGVCDSTTWSIDMTSSFQAFINNATFDNPYAFVLIYTEMTAPVVPLGTASSGGAGYETVAANYPNYLQLTF